jgi:hypothetical protein
MDTLAVTDAERQRAGARTLAGIRAFLATKNGTAEGSLAPPPVTAAPAARVELVGGIEALRREIRYPEAARVARISGRRESAAGCPAGRHGR